MSSDASSATEVTLVVKSVYERNLSLELKMEGSSTILQVKELLQDRLPSPALPKHQRLIFGGKICDDIQTLVQVLKRMDPNETYTFHLLVSQPNKAATPATQRTPPSQAAVAAPATAAVPPTRPIAPTASIPLSPYAAPRPVPGAPAPTFATTAPPTTPADSPSAVPSSISPLQTMHLQHYLAQQELMLTMQIQYLRHIQQFQQMHGIHFNPDAATAAYSTSPPAMPFPTAYFASFHVPPAATPPNVGAETPAAPRFQAIRSIVGLLDFTLALKMCVMVYIIGQDLPPPRSYILVGLSFVVYLYVYMLMTGILLKIYDILKGNPHIDRAPAAAADNNGDLFNQLNDAVNAGPPGPPLVTIATDGGIIKDIQSFAVGLVLSLFPSWRPLASAPPAADVPAAVDPQG
ncbi:hypothetical protein DYB38_004550 [Aphanomyces astaci]|uniref:Ubiquitin-like domain-containing protein n=1 Tax=Aphanomyces astaci TaxID=112090 RepID=A0A397D0T7_APHAT|nr:hypothetical protein DYB38_004550 [Aphanomyces astaci]